MFTSGKINTINTLKKIYLEKVDTHDKISGGGFSLSGMRLRPPPPGDNSMPRGEPPAAGEHSLRVGDGEHSIPSISPSPSSPPSFEGVGEAGEVGAVLSHTEDR